MAAVADYILHLADNALVLGQRNAEWCGHGPVIEEDIALTNVALDLLGQIFPLTEDVQEELDFGERASYQIIGGQSFLSEHKTIFRPIARDYELIRAVSSGVIYHVGAVG